jgi:hypothetical protein
MARYVIEPDVALDLAASEAAGTVVAVATMDDLLN